MLRLRSNTITVVQSKADRDKVARKAGLLFHPQVLHAGKEDNAVTALKTTLRRKSFEEKKALKEKNDDDLQEVADFVVRWSEAGHAVLGWSDEMPSPTLRIFGTGQ